MSDKSEVLESLKYSNIFLTGGAGVGKSYITNEVILDYRNRGKQVVSLGSTGVSAVNIGGYTVHSFFIFGIASNFEDLEKGDKRSKSRLNDLKKILKATNLIIIDEISMISANLMDMIAYRLNKYGYLGKVMFVGDFFQLPPIQRRGERGDVFGEKLYAFESLAWDRFELDVIELKDMKRTDDLEFTHILSKIREGICDDEIVTYILNLCNNEIKVKNPTYLFGRNKEVDEINRAKLSELKEEETILFAELTKTGSIHEDKLKNWKNMLPINEMLTLKIGVPVLFTVNKWGKFVNGDRGMLKSIENDHLIVEKDHEYVRVERHEFDMLDMIVHSDGSVENITLATLSQFPLKLAYAVTIHKSQGMSIDNLVCSVDNIFAPSQFYVAISRSVNPQNLKIDFKKGDISSYLHKVIKVDSRVTEYYKGLK